MRRAALLFFFFMVSLSLMGQEERVYHFHSDIVVDTSGVISVREKIRIYAAGDLFKRGITRPLPLYRTDADGRSVKVSYDIKGVYQDDAPVPFFTEREGGDLVIYVGEEDVYLSPGYYTYLIEYETPGQVGFFDGYDELSWNICGESIAPIDTASGVVYLPPSAEVLSHTCYRGYGGMVGECSSEVRADSTAVYAEAMHLGSHDYLTISVAFTKGVVSPRLFDAYQPAKPVTSFDKKGLPHLGLLVLLLLLPYYIITWRRYGIDPPKPVVVPQFAPPSGISPAGLGMLRAERYTNDLITSSLVSLAVKGYIQIKDDEERRGIFGIRKDRHYVLAKLKEADNSLPIEEAAIVRDLFRKQDEVLITGEYDSDIAKLVSAYQTNLEIQYAPILKEGRNRKFLIFPILLILAFLLSFIYFYKFESEPLRHIFTISTSLSLSVVTVVAAILSAIFPRAKRFWFRSILGGAITLVAVAPLLVLPEEQLSYNIRGFAMVVPLIISSYYLYAYLIKQPGKKKLLYQSQIKGLEMYIKAAEERRLQYLNPPKMTPEVFEALLPYAIAMNMGQVWGEKFDRKFASATVKPEDYQPTWYAGTISDPASFGHVLDSTLSNTLNHSVADSRTSLSGGNWNSGSFGGGFSGGGGGGGGVGGW